MKSKQEHFRNGTFRADRHEGKIDPTPADSIPEPPPHLTKSEAKIFSEIAALMFENDSLSSLDVYALENYSVQLNLFRKAKSELEKSGQYITSHVNKNGSANLVPSPWLVVLKNTSDILLKLSAKLAMTPVDRNKAGKIEKKNDYDTSLFR